MQTDNINRREFFGQTAQGVAGAGVVALAGGRGEVQASLTVAADTSDSRGSSGDLKQMVNDYFGDGHDDRPKPDDHIGGSVSYKLYKQTSIKDAPHSSRGPNDQTEPVKSMARRLHSLMSGVVSTLDELTFPENKADYDKQFSFQPAAVAEKVSPEARRELEKLAAPVVRSVTDFVKGATDWTKKHGEPNPVDLVA